MDELEVSNKLKCMNQDEIGEETEKMICSKNERATKENLETHVLTDSDYQERDDWEISLG